ncbi:hypothetical protein V8G54_015406 [Vigna mungo]|uniref:Uncharacterized protein n=1 Tax=Vigna mungo TaxID=3915 RepID=A0AAQ3S059_VIGMU
MHLNKGIEGTNIRLASHGSHLFKNLDGKLVFSGLLKSGQKGGVGKDVRLNPLVQHLGFKLECLLQQTTFSTSRYQGIVSNNSGRKGIGFHLSEDLHSLSGASGLAKNIQ